MERHVAAHRIRNLPIPLLMQQLLGPLLVHLFIGAAMTGQPDLERTCSVFTSTFLRAVGADDPDKEGS